MNPRTLSRDPFFFITAQPIYYSLRCETGERFLLISLSILHCALETPEPSSQLRLQIALSKNLFIRYKKRPFGYNGPH